MGHEIARGGILDWNEMYSQTGDWIRRLKLDSVEPTTKVKNLGIGKQQLIEIARVLRLPHMKILILDEPTASLTESETELLLDILRQLKRDGIACIYISHKIEEVMTIADRVTVLRDGKTAGGGSIRELSKKDIVRLMVGRELTDYYPKDPHADPKVCVLEVKDFSVTDHSTGKPIERRGLPPVPRGNPGSVRPGRGRPHGAGPACSARLRADRAGEIRIKGQEDPLIRRGPLCARGWLT